MIDLWDSLRYSEQLYDKVKNRFAQQIDAGILHIHRGYSTEKLAQFPDHTFDWIYIDTNHTYETTKQELNLCRHKVKPSGIIAGHDYVQGDWKMRVRYGVVEAVNEFCVKNSWEIVYLTNETHRHLSFALRKISK